MKAAKLFSPIFSLLKHQACGKGRHIFDRVPAPNTYNSRFDLRNKMQKIMAIRYCIQKCQQLDNLSAYQNIAFLGLERYFFDRPL